MKNCRIINFKKIGNNDIGFLIALEGNREIPFDIKRIYYIYNVPKEIKRGFHAHKRLEQVLICMSGSIKIKADNGNEKKIIELNSPNKGLYIGPGVWHEMCDFSQNSVLLVLASDYYNEKDYIRDYEKYLEEIRRNKMTIYNSIIINPAEYLKPAYRISPFSEKNIISNHFLDECNTVDLYLKNKFKNKEFIYTENGRNAISIALSKLNLSSLDEITILTTTNNFYISSCVTSEIEKFCKWNRKINNKTKAILINHEFGFCSEELKKIKEYGLPIIEDFAHSFNSYDSNKIAGTVGDFAIFSLSKFFPIQVGGILFFKIKYNIAEVVDRSTKAYIQKALSNYVTCIDKISLRRIKNYNYLSSLFKTINLYPYFKIKKGDIPGVFMFKTNLIDDLNDLKNYMNSNGVESSIFYGKNAYFIPCHQNLLKDDMNYFYYLLKFYIENQRRIKK